MPLRSISLRLAGACLALLTLAGVLTAGAAPAQSSRASGEAAAASSSAAGVRVAGRPDFARMARQQAETDRAWEAASVGFMRMEKITYRSSRDGLEIPAFVFLPLEIKGAQRHAALVWVHEDIRGHLYEHYIPYIREATARGYVVIAPEYRGSIGYGRAFYDAIDYGGAEVDDVVTAVSALKARYPMVDPSDIGIVGWSHGGFITLLSIFRNPVTFRSAVAIAPVTNLFYRLARKGMEQQRKAIDPQNRFGGRPSERPDVYRYRSPLFHVDDLRIPLLVHVADNDEDVDIDETMPLVDALRARKPELAEVKVYHNPPGGHLFDRRVSPTAHEPENTNAQRDSWSRVWTFLEKTLAPATTN